MTRPRTRAWWSWLGGLGLAALCFGLGWWASATVLQPPTDPLDDPEPIIYTVTEGTVGRTVPLNAQAGWPVGAGLQSRAEGTVTSVVVDNGQAVADGDVLFTVGLRPVVVATGTVPAFRELRAGMAGRDVRQLQAMLVELGHLDERPDGRFGSTTTDGVEAWQRDLGVDVTGVVAPGDLLFLPGLPAPVQLAEAVVVGNLLGGSDVVVRPVTGPPEFTMVLDAAQRGLVEVGAAVAIEHGDGRWSSTVATVTEQPDTGQVIFELVGDNGPVCANSCDRVPVGPTTDYLAEATLIEPATGPVVPVAAIISRPDGSTVVVTADGDELPVTVVSAVGGRAVVEGVDVGAQVRVAGESVAESGRPDGEVADRGGDGAASLTPSPGPS